MVKKHKTDTFDQRIIHTFIMDLVQIKKKRITVDVANK